MRWYSDFAEATVNLWKYFLYRMPKLKMIFIFCFFNFSLIFVMLYDNRVGFFSNKFKMTERHPYKFILVAFVFKYMVSQNIEISRIMAHNKMAIKTGNLCWIFKLWLHFRTHLFNLNENCNALKKFGQWKQNNYILREILA